MFLLCLPVFLPFAYRFPTIFITFPYRFPTAFPTVLSYRFPTVFLPVYMGSHITFHWLSNGFPYGTPLPAHGFRVVFLLSSWGFLWFPCALSHGLLVTLLWFSCFFYLMAFQALTYKLCLPSFARQALLAKLCLPSFVAPVVCPSFVV